MSRDDLRISPAWMWMLLRYSARMGGTIRDLIHSTCQTHRQYQEGTKLGNSRSLAPHTPTLSSLFSLSSLLSPCSHFMQSHIRKVHAYLAGTCHLHFWKNDQGLLHAAAIKWGWKGC